MTDTEATRIVAEKMGLPHFEDDDEAWADARGYLFDPTNNAYHEQLVREWARENLTASEQRQVVEKLCDEGYKRFRADLEKHGRRKGYYPLFWFDTSDLTKAVARVLAERKEQDND